MTEKEIIERLMAKAEAARESQNYYFKNRNDVNLRLSKAKEFNLDMFLKELRKRGFNPDPFKKEDNKQANIF